MKKQQCEPKSRHGNSRQEAQKAQRSRVLARFKNLVLLHLPCEAIVGGKKGSSQCFCTFYAFLRPLNCGFQVDVGSTLA
jgi:hypothetical protein